LGALRAEHEAQLALQKQAERERVPNLTLQAFLQSDGFNERVAGAGFSIPIFLPAPLGPSHRGEIDKAAATARAIEAEVAARERQVRQEVDAAAALLEARESQAARYSRQRIDRARAHIDAVVEAIRTSKLAVREGLLSLRALIDLVDRGTTSRAALFAARLALARAAALPLEEVVP
jgi:outer membrane protein TolC